LSVNERREIQQYLSSFSWQYRLVEPMNTHTPDIGRAMADLQRKYNIIPVYLFTYSFVGYNNRQF